MSLRAWYLGLVSLVLVAQSGCCMVSDCCTIAWGPAGPPCARTWCGSQCGECFWHEWFSLPPLCQDKCNCCGEFTCSNNPYVLAGPPQAKFGPLYDDGVGRKPTRESASGQPERAPAPAPAPSPTPSEAPPEAAPPEDLPPLGPTTSVWRDRYGRQVSYDDTIDRRPPSRKLGRPPVRYYR
ncbi:MAG TPA: hypothetical protein VL175_14020 [Pirellulales bacterium]|nr:hypothetical protein [Pirellulales bacterium]